MQKDYNDLNTFEVMPSAEEEKFIEELEENFVERVGIDKTKITGLKIKGVDYVYLQNNKDFEDMVEIKATCDTNNIYEIEIKDNFFGRLKITPVKNENTYIGELELIMEYKKNLNNMTTAEYKERIKRVTKYLREVYRIDFAKGLSSKDIEVKYIEINTTLCVEKPFCEYDYVCKWFNSVYRDKKCKNGANNKVAEYSTVQHNSFTKSLETLYSYFRSYKFVIYDKTKEFEDLYNIKLKNQYIRIEFKLDRADAHIKSNFSKLCDINDETIATLFRSMIEENLIIPFEESVNNLDEEKNLLAEELSRPNNVKWSERLLIFLLRKERNINRQPILDVAYLEPYIKEIRKKDTNLYRTINNMRDFFDGTPYGSNKYLADEIIGKLKNIFKNYEKDVNKFN